MSVPGTQAMQVVLDAQSRQLVMLQAAVQEELVRVYPDVQVRQVVASEQVWQLGMAVRQEARHCWPSDDSWYCQAQTMHVLTPLQTRQLEMVQTSLSQLPPEFTFHPLRHCKQEEVLVGQLMQLPSEQVGRHWVAVGLRE